MNTYARSMIAAFVATVALSLLMLLKGMMGLMPAMNPIDMLAGMAHARMGMPASSAIGWMAHFVIGTVVWGVLFALLYRALPGATALAKGLSFSVLAWLLMMIMPMPMAGMGLFGMKLGMMAPAMTLMMHLVWGAVLGYVYGKLSAQTATH